MLPILISYFGTGLFFIAIPAIGCNISKLSSMYLRIYLVVQYRGNKDYAALPFTFVYLLA